LAANRVLDTVPSFAFYEGAARLAGTPYEAVALGRDFALPLDALLARMAGSPGVLFLALPHAPTGALFAETDVRRLVAKANEAGWLVALDEAYFQFSGTDHRALARENPSVVLTRTFSKAFGLGGIRAGYLLGAPEVAAKLQALLPPFEVPAHTAAVIETVLEAPERATEAARRLVAERERMTQAVYPSRANFFLVRTPDAEAAWKGLLAAGILVRRQDHLPGLGGCLRVSVGAPSENDAFLRAALALR
jgi:histidinol-phosphate aminotransferase